MIIYIPKYKQRDKIRIGDLVALMLIVNYEKEINNHKISYDCSDPVHKSLKANILFSNYIDFSDSTENEEELLDDTLLWVKAPFFLEKYGNKILPKLNFDNNLYNGVKIPSEDYIVVSTLFHPEYNFYRKMEVSFINNLISTLEQKFKNIFIITDEPDLVEVTSSTIIKTNSLYDIVYLISKSKVYIGGDTGFTHFAALARVANIVSIYGENFLDTNFVKSGEYKGTPFNSMPLIDDSSSNHFSFILEQNKLSPKQIEQLINIVKEQLECNEVNTLNIIKKYIEIDHKKYALKLLNKLIEDGNDTYDTWYLLGKASLEVNKDVAMLAFKKCMELDSTANIFIDLARCYYFWRDYNDSIMILEAMLVENKNNSDAYRLLSLNYLALGNSELSFEYMKKAYESNDLDVEILVDLSKLVLELGDYETARLLLIKSIETDKVYARAYFHLSLIELLFGNYKVGWEYYEWRYNITSKSRMRTVPVPMPHYNREDLKDKQILIYHEQGFGDTIQFIRYVKILQNRGAIVFVFVQPSLEKLLKENFININFIDKIEDSYSCDYHLSMMSLPYATQTYKPIEESILSAKKKVNKNIKKDTFNVGIVWQGNPEHTNDHNRSIKPYKLSGLSKVKGIQLYSLQKDATKNDQKQVSKNIIDLVRKSKNFYDTAQVIQELDLVITIDSSVAHLSASLGKDTWLLLPHNPDWRWGLEGNTTPWYKNIVLFRKTREQTWEDVIDIVTEKLKQKYKK